MITLREACSSWKAASQPQPSEGWKSSVVSKVNLPVANIFPFLLISILFFAKITLFSSMLFTSSGILREQSHPFSVICFAHFWRISPWGTPWLFLFLSSPARADVYSWPQILFREWLHCRLSWTWAHIFVCTQPWGRHHTPHAATHCSIQPSVRPQRSHNMQHPNMRFPSATFPQVLALVPFTLPASQPSSPPELDYYCLPIIYLFVCSLYELPASASPG